MEESSAEATECTDNLPTDLVCDLLRHTERRHLLLVLRDSDDPIGIDRLARLLVVETSSFEFDDVDSLTVNLHHIHLPMLAEAEMITRTDNNRDIQLTEQGTALVAALVGSPLAPSEVFE